MTRSLAEASSLDTVVGACVADPDRWMTAIDDQAKAVCRDCPRRWLCAREACEMPRAEGDVGRRRHPRSGARARSRASAAAVIGRAGWLSGPRFVVRQAKKFWQLLSQCSPMVSQAGRMTGNDHPNRPAQPPCHALW
jgi:hypothetical protein